MLTQILFAAFLRISLGFAQCDNVYYTSDGDLCYADRTDTDFSSDVCVDIPSIGNIVAFTRNPVTEEFYVMALNGSDTIYLLNGNVEVDYYFYKFNARFNASDNNTLYVDEPVQIGDVVTTVSDKIEALAFTCNGVPRLFGLSTDRETTQYLYEIDYQTDGALTEVESFDISASVTVAGYGLFYSFERDRLYRIAGVPTTAYEINPNDIAGSAGEVTSFTWGNSWNQGYTQFASYYSENMFLTGSLFSSFTFGGNVDNASYTDEDAAGRRTVFASGAVAGYECTDNVAVCQALFTNEPSLEPSGQPSQTPTTDPSMMPSTDPSMMPSSDPSSMPTEMPTEMMTTEDEVMADTTMEPESPEATEDSPEPTVADSASKNSISFIMVFVAAFGYLFY